MDGGSVKDGDMDARNQLALLPEKTTQYFSANINLA